MLIDVVVAIVAVSILPAIYLVCVDICKLHRLRPRLRVQASKGKVGGGD
jgi:hypothetical protein